MTHLQCNNYKNVPPAAENTFSDRSSNQLGKFYGDILLVLSFTDSLVVSPYLKFNSGTNASNSHSKPI